MRVVLLHSVFLAACISLAGCGLLLDLGAPESTSTDGAGMDAARPDVGARDASTEDRVGSTDGVAGDVKPVDAATPDVGRGDAVSSDVGPVDAPPIADAAGPDRGGRMCALGDRCNFADSCCATSLVCDIPREACLPGCNSDLDCRATCNTEYQRCSCATSEDCLPGRVCEPDAGVCIDTQNDPRNCGRIGSVCGLGVRCAGGECVP